MTDPATSDPELSHIRDDGSAHMVDVSAKAPTARRATATGTVTTTPAVIAAISAGELPKGEAIGTARIAGIMAAKKTSDLVPLCHPLALSNVEVNIRPAVDRLLIEATVATVGPTGVEMEALTAVSVAALTLFDMIKAVDPAAVIGEIKVTSKTGGKTGEWVRG